MANNLVSLLMNEFRGDALNKIASAVGETPAKAQAGFSAVLPALFGGLASKASTSEGANQLLDLMHRNNFAGDQYADLARNVTSSNGITNLMNVGRPLLDSVFGGRIGSVTDWVSSHAGINKSSSASMLSMALPMVLGLLGRKVSSAGGSASSLMEMLTEQQPFLKEAPAGLATALGFDKAAFVGTYEQTAPVQERREQPVVAAYAAQAQAQERRGVSPWLWALPLLAVLGLLAYIFMPRQANEVASATVGTVQTADRSAFVPKTLPGAVTLSVPPNGVESKLVAFIEDPNRQVDKETWFSFDRLEFETGSAQLRPTSREQLENVAAILKAYPQVHVKIGGYTDNVGDDASNLKLSADRASNTMTTIADLGIDKGRMEAEGYGPKFPVADNGTEDGRQRNRRIDIRVTQK